jgi:hypothetical protein
MDPKTTTEVIQRSLWMFVVPIVGLVLMLNLGAPSWAYLAIIVFGVFVCFCAARMETDDPRSLSSSWSPELIVRQMNARDRMGRDERASHATELRGRRRYLFVAKLVGAELVILGGICCFVRF